MITFSCLEPEWKHPKSFDKSIADVAIDLEKRFSLCERFFEFVAPGMEESFEVLVSRERDPFGEGVMQSVLYNLSQWVTNQWREYIKFAKHGIKTKTATSEGRTSFIDTTAYFLSMEIVIR